MKKSASSTKLWTGSSVELCLEDESHKKSIATEYWKITSKFLAVSRRIVAFPHIGSRTVLWFWIKSYTTNKWQSN